MTFGGEDLYPEPTDKAASLMHALVVNHSSVDGNKPVGTRAADLFLMGNEIEPEFSSAKLTDLTFAVARGQVSAAALAIWIRQRCRRAEG